MSLPEYVPLKAQYVGLTAINRFVGHISSPRVNMISGQLQQKIVIKKPDVSLNQTGIELQLSDGTFGKRMPSDATILAIHTMSNHKTTWRKFILYRDTNTGVIGHVELRNYHTLHSRLGFSTIQTPTCSNLKVGDFVPKDTLLDDTPGVVDGIYCFGRTMNVCLGSFESTAEDTFIFSDEIVDTLEYDTIEKIQIKIKSNQILLYIHGENKDKLIPEPGEMLNKDGIVAVLRTIDPSIMPAQMSPKNIRKIDYTLDDIIEMQDGYEAEVIDMSVIRDVDKKEYISDTFNQLDVLATRQVDYYSAILHSYRTIVCTEHNNVIRKRGVTYDVECTNETTAYLTRLSMIIERRDQNKNKIKLTQRGEDVCPYTIELTIRKRRTPNCGSKFTDLSASKGVIGGIWSKDRMPINEHGIRADALASQTAVTNRNSVGRLYGVYFDQIADNTARRVTQHYQTGLNINPTKQLWKSSRRRIRNSIRQSVMSNDAVHQWCYEHLMGMYKIICPDQYNVLLTQTDQKDILEWIVSIIHYGGAIITQTVDNMYGKALEMVEKLEDGIYAPIPTPITYINSAGKKVTTKKPIRIAPMYIYPLDRDGAECSATDTIKLQSQLFTATVSKADKNRSPMSSSNAAILGIDESTIFASALDPKAMAELIDRNNSPKTHALMVKTILESDKPTGEYTLVDRDIHKYGTTTANRVLTHMLGAYGAQLVYKDDDDI